MTIHVLLCDGTWNGNGGSAAAESLRRGLSKKIKFSYVPYKGQFGPATGVNHVSAAESVNDGVKNLTRAIEKTPHPVVVAGYSQGCLVAYKFAREVLPKRKDLDVRAIACMGNPHEPEHRGGRGGIAEHLSLPKGLPLLSVWADGDPIADIHKAAPLRSVWDFTEYMSVRDLNSARRWLSDISGKVADGPQGWWRRPDFIESIRAANAYVFGTQHSLDYSRKGHALRLARMIEKYA